MAHITTCTSCGAAYEESSEEVANAPTRECPSCWRIRNYSGGERDDDGYCACGAIHSIEEIDHGACDCCGGTVED
jgi:hypothetical protein